MADQTGNLRCTLGCWGMGLLAGGLAAVMFRLLGGFSWPGAVFVGLLMFVAIGVALGAMLCKPLPTMAEMQAKSAAMRPVMTQSVVVPVVTAPVAVVAAPVHASVELPPVAADGKPAMMLAARNGKADDLKEIKGVGPKLEEMLHGMGVFHFDQIASWRAPEVAWVDDNLEGFKGRVTRDDWVSQARMLAAGGETAHSRQVSEGSA